MGELIQFPGSNQGGERESGSNLTPKELAVVDKARTVFGAAVTKASNEVGDPSIAASLIEGMSTDDGWTVVPLSDS